MTGTRARTRGKSADVGSPLAPIFLSYRRSDTRAVVGRVADHLHAEFGSGAVTWDIASIPAGSDYRVFLATRLQHCTVAIVLVGCDWLGPRQGGPSRIHDPDDFVRMEVLSALALRRHVLPVLVEDAALPPPEQLPTELHGLLGLQAARLDIGRNFHADMARLVARLRELGVSSPTRGDLRVVHTKQDRDDQGFPTASVTLVNRASCAQIIHRLDLEIVAFSPLRSAAGTRVLHPLDVWDVTLRREAGMQSHIPHAPVLIRPDDAARLALRFFCGSAQQAVPASLAGRWQVRLRFHSDGELQSESQLLAF